MTIDSEWSRILKDRAKQIRNISEESNVDLWKAYNLVGNLIFIIIKLGAQEPNIVSESCSKRIALTANMVQSFNAVQDLISSGAYWSASAVLRQQMETLSRIIEYRNGNNRVDKKPPNVKGLPFNIAPNYGRLSELCHTSGGEILGDFVSCSEGEGIATTLPQYRKEWAIDYFSLHIAHMLILAIEIYIMQEELYPGIALPNIDEEILNIANLLVKTGFWKEYNEKS